jgi:thioredoxin reductase (NADPH)
MTDVGNVTRPRGASSFSRYEQTFPTLTPHEIDRMRRFGRGAALQAWRSAVRNRQARPGMFVVLSGHVSITSVTGLAVSHPSSISRPGNSWPRSASFPGRVALVDAMPKATSRRC